MIELREDKEHEEMYNMMNDRFSIEYYKRLIDELRKPYWCNSKEDPYISRRNIDAMREAADGIENLMKLLRQNKIRIEKR